MPLTGIEPARDYSHIDLNDTRLPVPPQRHYMLHYTKFLDEIKD